MDKMLKCLKKKAVGYSEEEITSEYLVDENGEKRLIKEKILLKHYPPDVSALKLFYELNRVEDFDKLSDDELAKEKSRLLEKLVIVS